MTRVPANRYAIFCLIASGGFLFDLWSKNTVFDWLGYPHGVSKAYIDSWVTFRFYTSFNHGALWGLGQGFSWLFASLSIVAIIAVVYWLFVRGAAVSLWLTVSLAAIMSGTLGNLWDRLGLHGCIDNNGDPLFAVRDFLLFTFGKFPWPVFNLADVFLVTGAVMLVLQSFGSEKQPETDVATQSAEETTPAGAGTG
jgi:signal peptidase II